jgi:hypothetical protein
LYQPGGLMNPGWFRVPSGEHEGRLHISGWRLSAIKGEGFGARDDGWLSYATCPICHVMVVADPKPGLGDQTWAHERWHARNDFPVPGELLTDADRQAGYARS